MKWGIGICGALAVGLAVFGAIHILLDPEAGPAVLIAAAVLAVAAAVQLVLVRRRSNGAWERDSVYGEICLQSVTPEEAGNGTLSYRIDAELALPGRVPVAGRYMATIPPYVAGRAMPGARFECRTVPDDPTRVLVRLEPERPDRWVEFLPPWSGESRTRAA